jgi:3-phenylpropionate/trans-cinnamate dioxygenase ferredoxin component
MPNWIKTLKVADVAEGQARVFEADGQRIAICHAEGQLYAIDDLCTHDGGPLGEGEIEGHCIVCPRHYAKFDICTGKAVTLPAVGYVATYPVKSEGDEIVVDIGSPTHETKGKTQMTS